MALEGPAPKEKKILTQEEVLNWYVRMAKMWIKNNYGIDLNNTEYLYLRQIAKESVANQDNTEKAREERYRSSGQISIDKFNAEEDIPIIFMERMYGIRDTDIPKKFLVKTVSAHGEPLVFNNRLEAIAKKEELEKQGNQVLFQESRQATDAFKTLLRRKREKKDFEEEIN